MPLPHLAVILIVVLLAAAATVALAVWVGPVAGLSVPVLLAVALVLRLLLGRQR